MIKLKRAYKATSPDDGLRILVERLWPCGVSTQEAHIDLWLKLITKDKSVTFIYAASDEERNSALVLKEFLEQDRK